MKNIHYLPLVLLAVMSVQPVGAANKAPAAKDTVVLQRVPVPGTDHEMGLGVAQFPPNASKPRHKATGPEVVYVLEGELTVQVDKQPTKIVHAGESYQMPANVVHVTTAGPAGAKVVATWAWVPGQPFNIVVPD
jgi:quercetin dioxygenase-like cupin family protein